MNPELEVGMRVRAVYDDQIVIGTITAKRRRSVTLDRLAPRLSLRMWNIEPLPERQP